jgi:hypothetical protein
MPYHQTCCQATRIGIRVGTCVHSTSASGYQLNLRGDLTSPLLINFNMMHVRMACLTILNFARLARPYMPNAYTAQDEISDMSRSYPQSIRHYALFSYKSRIRRLELSLKSQVPVSSPPGFVVLYMGTAACHLSTVAALTGGLILNTKTCYLQLGRHCRSAQLHTSEHQHWKSRAIFS